MQNTKEKHMKVGFGESLCYLMTNIGNIPLMSLLGTFFLIFYTDVVGLDPTKLATLFLISKVVDGISDPIMGFFLDKFPVTKMGKFRPMLIIGTVICVINYILLWFGAVWAPVGKYVIVYATYLLLGLTFDIMDIALNSMLPVITSDNRERSKLSTIKAVGYTVGSLVLSIVGPLIVAEAKLESYYVLIFGSMAVVLLCSIGGALGVKERVEFTEAQEEKYTFKDLIKILFTGPVLVTFLANLVRGIGTMASSGAATFFYNYVMGDLSLMAGVSGVSIFGTLPGMLLSPILSNRVGKKKVYLLGSLIIALSFVIRLFMPTSLTLVYVGTIIYSFGNGLVFPQLYGIQADNTMYIQYTTGKRAEAAVASLSSFITKLGMGISGAIPGYLLAAFGFVTGAETQPESINTGILICVLILPIVFSILGSLIYGFGYKVTKEDVDNMSAKISEQDSAA